MRHTKNRSIVYFFLLAVVVTSVSAVRAEEYYMRADGVAANKTAATSCSAASTAMSVITHNAESFLPDDIIYLCENRTSQLFLLY